MMQSSVKHISGMCNAVRSVVQIAKQNTDGKNCFKFILIDHNYNYISQRRHKFSFIRIDNY